ncbi:GIY-YIG catalytic domain-containing protein [Priestia megaterium]|nr:GIY-YIG catalytic domain-containing protein [Priestia megaterium]
MKLITEYRFKFLKGKSIELVMYTPDTKKDIKETSGVYVFYNNIHEIMYIGESSNVRSRVMGHLASSVFKREIYRIGVFHHVMDKYQRLMLESNLCQKYNPIYNNKDKELESDEVKVFIKQGQLKNSGRIKQKIFNKIRELLSESRITQSELAEKYGVHRNTISNINGLKTDIYKQWEIERILSKGTAKK